MFSCCILSLHAYACISILAALKQWLSVYQTIYSIMRVKQGP